MRPLLLALVGLSLLLGQSPGPTGLTGAAATGSVGPQTIVRESGTAAADAIGATARSINSKTQTQGNMQSAIFVGAVVANVAAADIQ